MKIKFLFAGALLLFPIAFTGCGSSTEAYKVETEEVTAEEEAAYEEESYGSSGAEDEDQN